MQDKNRKHLFEIFESNIKSPDAKLLEILSKFKREDFIKLPIIFSLIIERRIKILETLHAHDISFTYRDASAATVLHVACGYAGSLAAVQFLIHNKIFTDVNAITDEGETPFMLAVMFGHCDIVKYLLENFKPNLVLRTISGDTAFSLARRANNATILNLLKVHEKT